MHIPDQFQERLKNAFDGRFRARWSLRNSEVQIEQKVSRAVLPPIRIDEGRDDLIRARDGYHYVLSVRTGTKMPCPTCQWTELQVPVREFVQIRCPYCASKGRSARVVVGYWPLDDTLIAHLQMIDPLRGGSEELAKAADRRNEALLASEEQKYLNNITAKGAEHFNELFQIQQFSYEKATSWPSPSTV